MDSSEQLSARRQKTDANDPVVPIRSEPWFSDGTIVLQVSATQFRVYRGILSANSPVFRDMFAVPQPQEDGELVEGCSVVHLQDSVNDWKCVLNALHERR